MTRQAHRRALPPGPRGWPLLGNVVAFRRDQLNFLLDLERTYGRMATITIGRTPVVLLFRPEHVRHVLVENPRNFTNREVAGGLIFGNLLVLSLLARSLSSQTTEGLQDFVGDGLLTSDGELHDRHRRLLAGAFTRASVERHAGLIVDYAREAVEHWRTGGEVDLAREVQILILRITGRILFDLDVQGTDIEDIIEGALAQPVGLAEALLSVQGVVPLAPYRRRQALLRRGDAFIYRIIDQRLAEHRDHGDVLSTLLTKPDGVPGGPLTRQEVRDELVSLLAAGHETTTNTIAWTCYLLDRHPAVLARVVGEVQAVLGERDPGVADLRALPYLDWVVKESMRLYPSAWTQGRHAVAAFDLDGYHFPPGTLVMFSQWVLHRLPDIWGDPDAFRPERWDPMGTEHPDVRWAFFPFGGGPRSCLGMPLANLEIRLILATVLQQVVPTLVPDHPVRPLPLITLRAKDGVRVRFRPASSVAWAPGAVAAGAGNVPGCPDDHSAVT